MLHKGRRCYGGHDMGKAGVLLTVVAGVGAAVVFQDFLGLGDHHQLPADQLLANELEGAAALAAGALGFRQIDDDLLSAAAMDIASLKQIYPGFIIP